MSFTSVAFLALIFPVCILVYYFIEGRYRKAFLLIISVAFYLYCGLKYVILIFALSTFVYCLGIILEQCKGVAFKKAVLVVGLLVNIGALVYYKYLFGILTAILPETSPLFTEGLFKSGSPVLPLGISFYTFSHLSYLLDVYWEICPAQKSIMNVWLYSAFFPKVIQGPIMRYVEFDTQLGQVKDQKLSANTLTLGLERFIKGMAKKVLIADHLQNLINYSFSNIAGVGTIPAWVSIICCMLQLYYDFSGYTDMAIGLGNMLGFALPENFDHPYMSSSVAEYWRRWHISLGAWFRDYVYTPCIRSLTDKKWAKALKQPIVVCDILALLVTWTITGIWHGSGMRFLIYGLWMCAFIIYERLRDNRRKKLKKSGKLKTLARNPWQKALDHTVTMLAVTFGMVFFRSDSLKTAMLYLMRMLIWNTADGILIFHLLNNYTVVILIVAMIFIFPVYEPLKGKTYDLFAKVKMESLFLLVYRIGLLVLFFVSFSFAVSEGYSAFLYEIF